MPGSPVMVLDLADNPSLTLSGDVTKDFIAITKSNKH